MGCIWCIMYPYHCFHQFFVGNSLVFASQYENWNPCRTVGSNRLENSLDCRSSQSRGIRCSKQRQWNVDDVDNDGAQRNGRANVLCEAEGQRGNLHKKNPSDKNWDVTPWSKFEGLVVGIPGHLRKCFISHPAVDEPSQLAFSSWGRANRSKGSINLKMGLNYKVGTLPIVNGVATYNPYKWVTTYRGYKL